MPVLITTKNGFKSNHMNKQTKYYLECEVKKKATYIHTVQHQERNAKEKHRAIQYKFGTRPFPIPFLSNYNKPTQPKLPIL